MPRREWKHSSDHHSRIASTMVEVCRSCHLLFCEGASTCLRGGIEQKSYFYQFRLVDHCLHVIRLDVNFSTICFLQQVYGVATYLKSLCMLIRLWERTNYATNMEKIFTTVVSLDILCRAFQRDNVSRERGHQSSLDAVVSIRRISQICIHHKLCYFWTSPY